MILNITNEFKIIEEISDLNAEGRFVLVELLKHCKGKLIGKLVRKKSSNALLMKYKRGLRQLKEQNFIVNTGFRGYYMLNPNKFVLFHDATTAINKFSFWYGLWYHLKYPDLKSSIIIKRHNNIVTEIKELWKDLYQSHPSKINIDDLTNFFPHSQAKDISQELQTFDLSWKDIIVFEPSLVLNALYQNIIPFKKELSEHEKLDTIYATIHQMKTSLRQQYQTAIPTIKRILQGKTRKIEDLHVQFDYSAYIAYELLNIYFSNEYPEML